MSPIRDRTGLHEQFWDFTLWPETRPVQVRVLKPFSSFVRWGEGFWDCQWPLNPWTHLVPGDFLVTGKGWDHWIPQEAVLCTAEWTFHHDRLSLTDARAAMVAMNVTNYGGCWASGQWDCQTEVAAAQSAPWRRKPGT